MAKLAFMGNVDWKKQISADEIVWNTKLSARILNVTNNALESIWIKKKWYIVVDLALTNPKENDIIVAYIDWSEKPIARIFKWQYLHSWNEDYWDIYPTDMTILWTVVWYFSSCH